ncbi:hypothetical protein SPBR_02873 [Sporothrix brasiliensis 5110]|uniref:Uncharacterized protein n=1 Tax=Sporothrix brasiliensis 5110 TaxID=1398154 RepID=A0A0C2J5D3_9PEZI|nr:uncharacterized protein SPBR_02873 [Sporothrix brasiliensis 5110]KIH92252.1 hypothetical protein SPBR_02873 [Sporothrix brasiliensis 5110]
MASARPPRGKSVYTGQGQGNDRSRLRYTPAGRNSTQSANRRYPSPDRRPRLRSRGASPPRRYRPASHTRQDDSDKSRRRRPPGVALERGRETGREPRHPPERRSNNVQRGASSTLKGVSSFLQRLGIIDDDPFAESAGDNYEYAFQRRPPHDPIQQHRRHHHDRDSSPYRRSPVSAHSPYSRRDASPLSDHDSDAGVVSKHDDVRGRGRGRGRDYDRDRDLSRDRYSDPYGNDRHDSDRHRRPSQRSYPSRARSAAGHNDDRSPSRSHRRSLKRGRPSSSSTSSSSSASMASSTASSTASSSSTLSSSALSSTRSSPSEPPMPSSKWESAARNALRAGTMAALTNHGAPGSWFGDKGSRVATAALGAALVDTYMGHRHPESLNGVRHMAMRQAAEYAINSIVAEPILERAARRKMGRRSGGGRG